MERASSRFAYLLEPIKDLSRNWEVDVAGQLEEYLTEIAEIRVSFDDGVTTLNFAEAALLIQGSTCVYSRKVEYLHALVYQTLDLISSNRKLAHGSSVDAQGRDMDISLRPTEEEQLLSLDDLPVANVDLEEDKNEKSLVPITIPRTPLSLVPLLGPERTNSTPLYSRTGELLGTRMDYKLNAGYLHSSGALIVDAQLVKSVTRKTVSEPTAVRRDTPPIAGANTPSSTGLRRGADDDEGNDGLPALDDSGLCDDLLGASPVLPPASGSRRPKHISPRQPRRRYKEEEYVDPLKPLDPHLRTQRDVKPFKKGVTYRTPAQRRDRKGERAGSKRSRGKPTEKLEPLALFIQRSLYSCSSLFPKSYMKAPASAEFEGLFWEQQKRLNEQRKADNRRMRATHTTDPVTELDNEVDEDPEGYQPLGEEDVEEEADDKQFHAAFEKHTVLTSSLGGAEPMALEEGISGEEQHRSERVCSYEDLVREYVESTAEAAVTNAADTALSKEVADWESRIKPILEEEEHRPVFDIHKCGRNIIDSFDGKDVLEFRELAKGKESYEISRLFVSTLQLANEGKVEISDGQVEFELKLLSAC